VQTANAHIDFAAATKITLQTAGGASIVLDAGGINVSCPGTLTVHAASKSMVGAGSVSYGMPALPRVALPPDIPFKFNLRITDAAGDGGMPMPNVPWQIVVAADATQALKQVKSVFSGKTATDGKVTLTTDGEKLLRRTYDSHPGRVWLVFHSQAREVVLTPEATQWDERERHAQALDAMGYTDTPGASGDGAVDQFVHTLARKESGAVSGAAALNKLKG